MDRPQGSGTISKLVVRPSHQIKLGPGLCLTFPVSLSKSTYSLVGTCLWSLCWWAGKNCRDRLVPVATKAWGHNKDTGCIMGTCFWIIRDESREEIDLGLVLANTKVLEDESGANEPKKAGDPREDGRRPQRNNHPGRGMSEYPEQPHASATELGWMESWMDGCHSYAARQQCCWGHQQDLLSSSTPPQRFLSSSPGSSECQPNPVYQ